MLRIIKIAIGLTLGFVTSCNSNPTEPQTASPQASLPAKPEGQGSMTNPRHPYFQLDEQELRKLKEGMRQIQLGDNRKHIEALLGKPSSDFLERTKETNKPIGHFVTYYVTQQEQGMVKEGLDRLILLRFDTSDSLVKVISNVEGIESRPKAVKAP